VLSVKLSLLMLAGLLAGLLASCKSPEAEPDAATEDLGVPDLAPEVDGPPAPDVAPAPDKGDPASVLVGAVQYTSGHFADVAGCGDDLCALGALVKEARKQGAEMVVLPEMAVEQTKAEWAPAVGDDLASGSRWQEGSISRTLGKLARDEKLILAFNLVTQEGQDLHNTNLAVGPDGKVLARHYKFQLFGGETKVYKPGTSIEHSFFESPAGRTGLLICADAQCIITNLTVTPDCAAASAALIKDYFSAAKKPDAILFSAFWTVGGTGVWAALNVQKRVATYGQAYLAASNNIEGQGKGGGIYEPSGNALAQDASGKPMVLVAAIPRKK
jgi:predicted amidohydrolase